MLSYGLGVGTVPWLLLGELCPTKVKGKTYILDLLNENSPILYFVTYYKKQLKSIGENV